MPIQINQKFPRCQLCGKLIPLRAEPRRITLADGRVVSFCSERCRQDYQRRLVDADRREPPVPARY